VPRTSLLAAFKEESDKFNVLENSAQANGEDLQLPVGTTYRPVFKEAILSKKLSPSYHKNFGPIKGLAGPLSRGISIFIFFSQLKKTKKEKNLKIDMPEQTSGANPLTGPKFLWCGPGQFFHFIFLFI